MNEDFILSYISDISDVARKAKEIERINKKLSETLGKDFTNATNIISRRLDKVQFDKSFSIRTDTGEIEKVTGNIEQFSTVVQTADGALFKFRETQGITEKGNVELGSSITALNQKASSLTGTFSQISTNFSNLTDVNRKFSKELSNVGNVNKFIGTTLNQVSESGTKTTKIFETVNGKFAALTETTKRLPNGVQEVTRTTKEMNKAQLANIITLENGKIATRGFADNLSTLLKRAALTIPVWFAIRQGIGTIFRTIRDGLKDIVAFERELEKIRRNLEGSFSETSADLSVLRKEIAQLAIQTGKSAVEISGAIKQFATIGFSLEESLGLANTATKTAVLLFEDAGETAESFARSFKVLQDTSKGAKSIQEQFNEAMALTVSLGENNADNLGEINEALLKSASSARLAGLSMNELIILLQTLATSGRAGAQAGTLLSSSLNKLLSNLDVIGPALGVVVEEGDKTFDVLGKILDASDKLANSDLIADRSRLVEAFGDIFGGERGTKVIGSLATVNRLFKENSKVLPDIEGFNRKFNELTTTIPIQADRFKVLNQEIGKAFVNGLVGGEDFAQTLQKINNFLENFVKGFNNFGRVISKTFDIKNLGIFGELSKIISEETQRQIGAADIEVGITGEKIFQSILKGFRKELNKDEIQKLISDIDVLGQQFTGIDQSALDSAKEQLKLQLEIVEAKKEQVDATKEQIIDEDTLKSLNNTLLNDALERSKAEGAVQSQIIKQELAVRKQLGFELKGVELLDKKLQLERAIIEEKKKAQEVSSDDVKIFKIAQQEGTKVAKSINDVLTGRTDFSTFFRKGGKALEVFKRDFADVFETEQVSAFKQGKRVPGLQGLRGGSRIFSSGVSKNIPSSFDPQVAIRERLAKESLQQKDEVIKNTSSLNNNTLSLQELTQAFNNGLRLNGGQATELLENQVSRQQNIDRIAGRLVPQTQRLEIDVNVDGRNISLVGTPERIRELAQQLGPQISQAIEQKLISDISNNPQSPAAQAVTKRQLET